MPSIKEDWEKTYNKSIIAFTGRNKIGGPEVRNALEDVVKGSMGLVGSMTTLEACDPGSVKINERPSALKSYEKEMNGAFAKEKKKYEGILDTAIKLCDKATWPLPYRELKVLKTQLTLASERVNSAYQSYTKETTAAREKLEKEIDKKSTALREKGASDEHVADETYILKAKKLLLIFVPTTKTAFAKAAAVVQKIKADPSPATYNEAMNAGGRDLSQQFNNLIKLANDPKAQSMPLVQKMPNLAPYRTALTEFGNGEKRRVENDATKEEILELIKEFSTMMKELIPIYTVIAQEVKKM